MLKMLSYLKRYISQDVLLIMIRNCYYCEKVKNIAKALPVFKPAERKKNKYKTSADWSETRKSSSSRFCAKLQLSCSTFIRR